MLLRLRTGTSRRKKLFSEENHSERTIELAKRDTERRKLINDTRCFFVLIIPHFEAIFDLLLNRPTEKQNLFAKYLYSWFTVLRIIEFAR